jgi:hypothetical protein
MTTPSLATLQERVQSITAFSSLKEYMQICNDYVLFLEEEQPTCIVSPTTSNYLFFQYGKDFNHRITRPLNSNLFLQSSVLFEQAFDRLIDFLSDLKQYQGDVCTQPGREAYCKSGEINMVVYTMQQAIGAIGDS